MLAGCGLVGEGARAGATNSARRPPRPARRERLRTSSCRRWRLWDVVVRAKNGSRTSMRGVVKSAGQDTRRNLTRSPIIPSLGTRPSYINLPSSSRVLLGSRQANSGGGSPTASPRPSSWQTDKQPPAAGPLYRLLSTPAPPWQLFADADRHAFHPSVEEAEAPTDTHATHAAAADFHNFFGLTQ